MSPIQAIILERINNRSWIFDEIQPLYHSALQNRCGVVESTNKSTLQLALLAYSNIELKSSAQSELMFLDKSDFEMESNFETLASKVFEAGYARCFSSYEKKLISETFVFLEQKNFETYSIFKNVFHAFFRIEGGNFCGASHPHAFGTYFAGDLFFSLDIEERAMSLVHELAHQEFFLVQLIDRLVQEGADYNLAYAPLQGKPRPTIGRLHSLAALARMIDFSRIIDCDKNALEQKLDENVRSFSLTELTTFGHKIVKALSCRTSKI